MRRAIGLALSLAMMPVTVTAHDETDYTDYLEDMATAMGQGPASVDEGIEAWAAMRTAVLSLQLATVPMTCYEPLYVSQWLLYADLVALEGARRRDMVAALDDVTTGIRASSELLAEMTAACFPDA